MRIVPVILAFLVSAGAASAQDDAVIKRILERIDRELAQRRQRLSRELRGIIQKELKRSKSNPSRPAPAKPKSEPKKPAPPKAVKKVRLGIVAEDFDEGERKKLGIGGGIKISEVREPAKSAGIKAGDILLELAGEPVTEDTILGLLEKQRPGDVVKVKVLRDGKRKTLDLKLAERGE